MDTPINEGRREPPSLSLAECENIFYGMYRLIDRLRNPESRLSTVRGFDIPKGFRLCRLCKKVKPVIEFGVSKELKDGISYKCRPCVNAKMREYRKTHRPKSRPRNMEKRRIRERRYDKLPRNKIVNRTRKTIRRYINGWRSHGKITEVMGCSRAEMITYLESKFQPLMTWENYNHAGWHVDHIIPCRAFDLTIKQHVRWCSNYRNLQPLWRKDNMDKKDRLSTGESAKRL